MRVLKLGGTSVADARRLVAAGRIVARAVAEDRAVVVVSALAGVTDSLVEATRLASAGDPGCVDLLNGLADRHLACLDELGGGARSRTSAGALRARLDVLGVLLGDVAGATGGDRWWRARVVATGERLAVPLAVAALRGAGLDAEGFDAAGLIVTDSRPGEAEVDRAATGRALAAWWQGLPPGRVPVVTGFIGADRRGRTTTLGRGGSDYTASLIGAVLGAARVEIWTDVEGVLSAPPALFATAATVPRLTYAEAASLAAFGAKVLHHKTMRPVVEGAIPIEVRSSFAPGGASTRIGPAAPAGRDFKAVSVRQGLTMLASGAGRGTADQAELVQVAREAAAWSDAWLALAAGGERAALVVPTPAATAVERALAGPLRRGREATPRLWHRCDGLAVVAAVGAGAAAGECAVSRVVASLERAGVASLATLAPPDAVTVAVLVEAGETHRAVAALHRDVVEGGGATAASRSRGSARPHQPIEPAVAQGGAS